MKLGLPKDWLPPEQGDSLSDLPTRCYFICWVKQKYYCKWQNQSHPELVQSKFHIKLPSIDLHSTSLLCQCHPQISQVLSPCLLARDTWSTPRGYMKPRWSTRFFVSPTYLLTYKISKVKVQNQWSPKKHLPKLETEHAQQYFSIAAVHFQQITQDIQVNLSCIKY